MDPSQQPKEEDARFLPQVIQVKELAPSTDEKTDKSSTAEDVQDTTPPTEEVDNDAKEEDPKVLQGGAQLFCPINGLSHSTLVDFGLSKCGLCGNKLAPPDSENPQPIPRPRQPRWHADSDISDSGSAISDSQSRRKLPAARDGIAYSVAYQDKSGNFMSLEDWEDEFDLSTAREGVDLSATRWQLSKSIFGVTTILRTSISQGPERHRSRRSILKNPDITVTIQSTDINIYSAPLIQLLRQIANYYPSVNFKGPLLKLEEPFPLIAHHYQELSNYRSANGTTESASETKGDQNRTGVGHLGKLLDYFESKILQAVREEEALHKKGLCTFRMLWLLYKPGDTVYLESEGRLSAFVVSSVKIDPAILRTAPPGIPLPYYITVWNLAYDGRYVGRTARTITVAAFEGQRRILSLRLIPCSFIDMGDGGAKRGELEKNGRKWYGLLPGGQVYYSGPLVDAHNRQLHGRVYIDPASFYSLEPPESSQRFPMPPLPQGKSRMGDRNNQASELIPVRDFGEELPDEYRRAQIGPARMINADEPIAKCPCEECRGMRPHPPPNFPWTHYDVLNPKIKKDLEIPGAAKGSLHRYLLCGHLLHAFDLRSRTWVKIDVAYCRPTKANLRAIDSLVMPQERLNMIKALIQKFTSTEPGDAPQHRAWAADFIENKGEGQIFLLHGGPGVGKTYTAGKSKCIAEYTERPLLSLTCGDIGTDEVKMEKQLSKWFRLAEKWGAVMLIDEADVYLERRLVTDLHRNSLVSVFLRCIEYYRGVLFLTTNRVGQFDDAFISRIHVIIRYDNLSAESRAKIWSHFFDKLDEEREEFRTTQRAKDYVLRDGEISKMEWNGREIRNAFQTAVALAEFRFLQNQGSSNAQPTLDQKDFEQVLNMMQQFKTYLVNVHGSNEDERAYNVRSRAHPYSC